MKLKTNSKKFHFYVNKCSECNDTTDISLRPHKPGLCKKCNEMYDKMLKQAKHDLKEEKELTKKALEERNKLK